VTVQVTIPLESELVTRHRFPSPCNLHLPGSPAHLLAIGSNPSRCGLPSRNLAIRADFLDSVLRKAEQFTKVQHVATDSCPSKRCSEHQKESAQRRDGKDGWRRTQHKCYATEYLAEGRDQYKERQRGHRHVDGKRGQTEVSIAQRFGKRPWNQVDNIVEMPLFPTLALLLAASLRQREITVDPRLADEKRWIARRGEGNPQSGIFRQPAVSKVTVQEQTEREGHPGVEELSWYPNSPKPSGLIQFLTRQAKRFTPLLGGAFSGASMR
jgi:hypothetical protein